MTTMHALVARAVHANGLPSRIGALCNGSHYGDGAAHNDAEVNCRNCLAIIKRQNKTTDARGHK